MQQIVTGLFVKNITIVLAKDIGESIDYAQGARRSWEIE
jgi:hypothetical protein